MTAVVKTILCKQIRQGELTPYTRHFLYLYEIPYEYKSENGTFYWSCVVLVGSSQKRTLSKELVPILQISAVV